MTTTRFLVYLARIVARLAYAIGYPETGNEVTNAIVEYEMGKE